MVSIESQISSWLLVLGAGLNSCIGNLMLKKAMFSFPKNITLDVQTLVSLALSPWVIGGLFFYGVNVLLFAVALRRLDVSVAYPALAGFGFALLTIAAGYLFGEELSLYQWLGAALVLTGIFFLSR